MIDRGKIPLFCLSRVFKICGDCAPRCHHKSSCSICKDGSFYPKLGKSLFSFYSSVSKRKLCLTLFGLRLAYFSFSGCQAFRLIWVAASSTFCWFWRSLALSITYLSGDGLSNCPRDLAGKQQNSGSQAKPPCVAQLHCSQFHHFISNQPGSSKFWVVVLRAITQNPEEPVRSARSCILSLRLDIIGQPQG